MTPEQKLEQFAEREFNKHCSNSILQGPDGEYAAFGMYHLRPVAHGVEVRNFSKDLVGHFSSKRSALGYCIADKFKRYNLAIQIKNLDAKKQILANDLLCSQSLVQRLPNNDFRDTVEIKMGPKQAQYQAVIRELEKCVNSAKYLQSKGFQNETSRVFTH